MTQSETDRALAVFAANKWHGDPPVNLMTAVNAGKVLARRIKELEEELEAVNAWFYRQRDTS